MRDTITDATQTATLGGLLYAAALRNPQGIALRESATGRYVRYFELEEQANRLASKWIDWGIGPGHRIGIWLPKSIESVATIHGSLRTGAAHVPVDPQAPPARAATIFSLAGLSAVVIHWQFVDGLRAAWPIERLSELPRLIIVGDHSKEMSGQDLNWSDLMAGSPVESILPIDQPATDLAYILFTSGKIWYSAPSILAMMVDHGRLSEAVESTLKPWPGPRITLFAGEVFPVGPLKALRKIWPDSIFWNLYGPTETNVCTAFKAPENLEDLEAPLPIGPVCEPLTGRVVDEQGADVTQGEEGELVIYGPRVMGGYFGREDLTESAFFRASDGRKWYRTGDLVRMDQTGAYHFHGRRDRMVKKRGYRIELGEIESAIYRNEAVGRAAVVAIQSEAHGLRISAFVAMKPDRPASIIALKRHCSTFLPHYMIPDDVKFLPELPTTSTDKVDYPALKKLAESLG